MTKEIYKTLKKIKKSELGKEKLEKDIISYEKENTIWNKFLNISGLKLKLENEKDTWIEGNFSIGYNNKKNIFNKVYWDSHCSCNGFDFQEKEWRVKDLIKNMGV